MQSIKLTRLHPDPKNPNICSPEILEKLKRHINRNKFYPALIVRPHPKNKSNYILIDGHHRKIVLESLGYKQANCQVINADEKEAQLLLATLNRLHGTDNLKKRAELVESLSELLPLDELAELLPESRTEIDDLIALLHQDLEEMEARLRSEIEQEARELPVALSFLIDPQDEKLVNQALDNFPAQDRGQSLVLLCKSAYKKMKS